MMRPLHLALAILVAVIWGVAFVFTKLALETFSPAQLVGLRFAIAALPALLLPFPRVPWRALVPIGLTLFAGQFLFQFLGIVHGMPPGLASVVVQTQGLFTVAFAAALGERPTSQEIAGMLAACVGLGCIAATVGGDLSLAGLALTIVSPISFGIGNILLRRLTRQSGELDMFGLITWLSLVPPLPMLALSLYVDGAAAWPAALGHASWIDMAAVLYLAVISTTFAYAIWGRLLHAYSAAQVSPFALLVPFVAALSSAVVFGEQFGALRLAGMAFVLVGLALVAVPYGRVQSLFSKGSPTL